MNIADIFEIATGTVAGRDHVLSNTHCQDAFHVLTTQDSIIAIICDGCGEGKHSEVGAKIGAKLIASYISKNRLRFQYDNIAMTETVERRILEQARQDVLAHIRILATSMGENFSQIITDYFLFTVVGALVTTKYTYVFTLGDGIFFHNGQMRRIGPFPNNEPPYMAYALTGSSLTDEKPELLKFNLHLSAATDAMESILIGSDGAADLVNLAGKKMPGKENLVGPISQFLGDDRYFRNPDMIRRKLFQINTPSQIIDWDSRRVIKEPGLLPDDTTMVVIRRKKEET